MSVKTRKSALTGACSPARETSRHGLRGRVTFGCHPRGGKIGASTIGATSDQGERVQKELIKLFITVVAAAVIGIRFLKPDITVDATTVTLLAMAVLPWLSPVVKSFEGLGFKVEFQDAPPETQPGRTARQPPTVQAVEAPALTADSYFERLIKLTPIEIVLTFIVTNAMVSLTGSTAVAWINFLALVALTPVFLSRVAGVTSASQLIASTVCFIAWAVALGGPFASLEWWSPLLGACVLAVVSLVAPFSKVA